jgi:group I intron endonuclease
MIVYKATCTCNGKAYIGITKNSLNIRIKQHKSKSKTHITKFYSAIRKHGIESFDWKVLANVSTYQQVFVLERLYILIFDSKKNGYNMTDGGEIPNPMKGNKNGMYGKTHSKEIKKRLRDRLKNKSWEEVFGEDMARQMKQRLIKKLTGRKHKKSTIKKMSENSFWANKGHLITGDKNPNYGKKWDEEKKNKVRGKNNGMYGKGYLLSGEKNGMWNKKHTNEARIKMSKEQRGDKNGNYRKLPEDVLSDLVSTYGKCESISQTAIAIGENYNKVKRELIRLNLI